MTKEELKSYKYINTELQYIKKQIKFLSEDIRSTKGVCYDDTPCSSSSVVAVQRYIEKLEELSELYEKKKTELVAFQIRIEQSIASLPPDLRVLMQYRYIDGMKWEDVNNMMYISETKSKNMHRKALKMLIE